MLGLFTTRFAIGRWFPGRCLLCDRPGGPVPNLCRACRDALPEAVRLGPGRVVALPYAPPVSNLVHWMKFDDGSIVARTRVGKSPITAAPRVVDDVLYVYGDGGDFAAIKVK